MSTSARTKSVVREPSIHTEERGVLTTEEVAAVEQHQRQELGLPPGVAPAFEGRKTGVVGHRDSNPEESGGRTTGLHAASERGHAPASVPLAL